MKPEALVNGALAGVLALGLLATSCAPPAQTPTETSTANATSTYDTQTRSQLQTDQQFPTLDTYTEGLQKNDDGSYTIYFGPTAPEGRESNWLQTVPGKSFFVCLRMYGPTQPWIDGVWRPSDVDLIG